MKTFVTILLAGTIFAGLAGCSDKSTTTSNTTAMMSSDTAAARAAPEKVRGAITAVGAQSITVQTYDGKSVDVALDGKTGYVWVLPSTLASVKQGDFIGTATTGPDDALKAVEVVIFPEAMRGTGEGHYGWDTPGVIQANGGGGGGGGTSGMTNGTVTQSGMTNGTVQESGMTNGTVSNTAAMAGEQQLTVSYKGGTAKVQVPKTVPIVSFAPADKAILAKGQKVFVIATAGSDGKLTAKSVAAGKNGLTPPM